MYEKSPIFGKNAEDQIQTICLTDFLQERIKKKRFLDINTKQVWYLI